MPTVQSGQQNTNTVLSNRKIIDMAPKIALLEDKVAPFTKALSMTKKKPAKSNQVWWLEDELRPRKSTCNGGATNVATTVNVATGEGQYFRAGDVVRCGRTGENLYVTSVSTDALTVTRSIGAVAAAAIASGEELWILSNAAMEGTTLGTVKIVQQTAVSNYTQIQRDPYSFSETEMAIDLYGGGEPNYEKGKKYIEHMRALENTLFYGQRDLNTGGAAPIGYAGGLIDYISTNVNNVGGSLSQATFESNLQTAFRYGSPNKVLFAAPVYGRAISAFALGKVNVNQQGKSQKYGIEVTTYTSHLGYEVDIVICHQWGDFATSNNESASRAFLVDMEKVTLRPLRDTKHLADRQAPDTDGISAEYLTEWTLQVENQQAHAHFYGCTG